MRLRHSFAAVHSLKAGPVPRSTGLLVSPAGGSAKTFESEIRLYFARFFIMQRGQKIFLEDKLRLIRDHTNGEDCFYVVDVLCIKQSTARSILCRALKDDPEELERPYGGAHCNPFLKTIPSALFSFSDSCGDSFLSMES